MTPVCRIRRGRRLKFRVFLLSKRFFLGFDGLASPLESLLAAQNNLYFFRLWFGGISRRRRDAKNDWVCLCFGGSVYWAVGRSRKTVELSVVPGFGSGYLAKAQRREERLGLFVLRGFGLLGRWAFSETVTGCLVRGVSSRFREGGAMPGMGRNSGGFAGHFVAETLWGSVRNARNRAGMQSTFGQPVSVSAGGLREAACGVQRHRRHDHERENADGELQNEVELINRHSSRLE